MLISLAALSAGLAAELTLIQPGEAATQLARKSAAPAIFHVGPNLLYRGKHIPGSIYAGPGSRAQGLEALRLAAGKPVEPPHLLLADVLWHREGVP